MIVVVDYGAGNLRSVAKALEKLGYRPAVTCDPEAVLKASTVILPGVGAAADIMNSLQKLDMVDAICQVISDNRPFFGICMGLEVLFTYSEEGGRHQCLDIVSGGVKKLPDGLKVPHMGWNQVKQKNYHPIFEGIPNGSYFYFIHSYYVDPEDRSVVAGETDYGVDFCSAVIKDRLVATQFHPEKSGDIGLRMFDNFLRWCGEKV